MRTRRCLGDPGLFQAVFRPILGKYLAGPSGALFLWFLGLEIRPLRGVLEGGGARKMGVSRTPPGRAFRFFAL